MPRWTKRRPKRKRLTERRRKELLRRRQLPTSWRRTTMPRPSRPPRGRCCQAPPSERLHRRIGGEQRKAAGAMGRKRRTHRLSKRSPDPNVPKNPGAGLPGLHAAAFLQRQSSGSARQFRSEIHHAGTAGTCKTDLDLPRASRGRDPGREAGFGRKACQAQRQRSAQRSHQMEMQRRSQEHNRTQTRAATRRLRREPRAQLHPPPFLVDRVLVDLSV